LRSVGPEQTELLVQQCAMRRTLVARRRPRLLILTTTDRPLARLVTHTQVPSSSD